MIGASSEDIRAEATVTLAGDVRVLSTAELVPTAVELD
jgi:hypothetical protein